MVTPPLLGVYVFNDHPSHRRQLVSLPARLAYYVVVDGRLHLHRLDASSVADWCHRLHGWMVTPPLLGVYVFTDRPPHRRRLVCLPARLAYYVDVVGRLHLLRLAALYAVDWYLRLYGWMVTPPLLGVYVFTAGLPSPAPTGVSACTAGLLYSHCWASLSSPTGRLVRRRLVFSPIRLVGHNTVVERLRLHHRLAFAAVDWCLRLHGWPIMPPLLDVYIFTDLLPHMTPTGAIVFTVGHIAATANRHHHLQRKLPTSAADWFLNSHDCMILPVLIWPYRLHRRSSLLLLTSALACTAGLYRYHY
ncbi:uncharacterized protein LOC127768475 [Oryza glaberrima]|uniref:uncharacterized protein LOC127768475 n=1 Tax=Oryza glaberrima TaxID=4538 RepID=UPI00224C2175|nr:uncharacterized protein LOC127768475 [Oryza glaberrima]XP_052150021.1 uncharacterized protein LOC127768475 [Oryza glaberrima]XP_052150022.1 uncharacterized protein LOC127768475 [Oryza glaberrima]XP_052150023.1 uncharacterized protein LOC127768475 [Oryza glaberrima]